MTKKKPRTKATGTPKRKPRQRRVSQAGKELFASMCEEITPAHCAAYALFVFSEPGDLTPEQRMGATEAAIAFANVGWIAYHNRPK
jgi:hypothetical protein